MQDLHNTENLEEFFVKRIQDSLSKHGFSISIEVEFYLVQLLKEFSRSENFFQVGPNGQIENRPLALMLYDAVFDESGHKFIHFKKMGDSALYQAGVFYESLINKVVDVDYYISMGQKAYASIAHQRTVSQKSLSDLYMELSESFPRLVEILALCCESEVQTNQNLLKWIERYQRTKSPKAKEILKSQGICAELILEDKDVQ